jgi:toxin YoeB
VKDSKKVVRSNLKTKALELISLLKQDPFQNPPQFEKLVGDLEGAYSRRINIQHRLVYQVLEQERIVKVLRMWTHYE